MFPFLNAADAIPNLSNVPMIGRYNEFFFITSPIDFPQPFMVAHPFSGLKAPPLSNTPLDCAHAINTSAPRDNRGPTPGIKFNSPDINSAIPKNISPFLNALTANVNPISPPIIGSLFRSFRENFFKNVFDIIFNAPIKPNLLTVFTTPLKLPNIPDKAATNPPIEVASNANPATIIDIRPNPPFFSGSGGGDSAFF